MKADPYFRTHNSGVICESYSIWRYLLVACERIHIFLHIRGKGTAINTIKILCATVQNLVARDFCTPGLSTYG